MKNMSRWDLLRFRWFVKKIFYWWHKDLFGLPLSPFSISKKKKKKQIKQLAWFVLVMIEEGQIARGRKRVKKKKWGVGEIWGQNVIGEIWGVWVRWGRRMADACSCGWSSPLMRRDRSRTILNWHTFLSLVSINPWTTNKLRDVALEELWSLFLKNNQYNIKHLFIFYIKYFLLLKYKYIFLF